MIRRTVAVLADVYPAAQLGFDAENSKSQPHDLDNPPKVIL